MTFSKEEWPETAAVIMTRFSSCSRILIGQVIQKSVQTAISHGVDELNDEKLAEIIKDSLKEDTYKSAALLMYTIPAIIENRIWLNRRKKPA